MYHPVCINTGMMALPPRGPSSAQQLWKGLCVSSRAEAEKVCREIPELDAWGCSHFQHDALWAAQHKRFAEHPRVLRRHREAAGCRAGGWTWEPGVLS